MFIELLKAIELEVGDALWNAARDAYVAQRTAPGRDCHVVDEEAPGFPVVASLPDVAKVERGGYGIDAPESKVNPR